jgi:hypothetical protein
VHWLVVVLVIEDPGEVLWGVDWARSNWGSSRLWDVNVFCSGLFFMVAIDIDWLLVTVVGMAGTVVFGDVVGGWSISVVVVAFVVVVAVSVVRVIGGVGVLVVVGLFTVVGVFVTVVVGLFIGVMVVGVGVVCVVISITGKVAVGWVIAAVTVATSVRVVIIVI